MLPPAGLGPRPLPGLATSFADDRPDRARKNLLRLLCAGIAIVSAQAQRDAIISRTLPAAVLSVNISIR